MSLFKDWENLATNQTDETFDDFWREYCEAEMKLYTSILEDGSGKFNGNFKELVEKFDVSPILFTGFLDGIKTSLKNDFNPETVTEDSEINLDVDFETLYFNMQKAEAQHLYTLEAWDNVLNEEDKKEVTKQFNKTKTVVKEKTPGRNDPCPCGSGKKYKKCCGK